MKLLIKIVFVVCLTLNMGFAATTLSAGDIAIFGLNADAPDDFGFVLLVDIESGTEIRFTDSGWLSTNTFRGNEGAQKYTAPSDLSAGTEITFSGNSSNFQEDNDATVGNNDFNLAARGDQLFAFQGSSTAPTFIFALQSNSTEWQSTSLTANDSAIPKGLTDGVNALAFGFGDGAGDEYDNIAYNKSTMSGTTSQLLAAVVNSENWLGDNDVSYDVTTYDFKISDDPPLPITLSSFSVDVLGAAVKISWETASETNNAQFIVYRNGEAIATVDGAGTTSETNNYTLTDHAVKPGAVYTYVLADLSTANVEKKYEAKAITVEMPITESASAENFVIAAAYPNPFNPTAQLPITIMADAKVRIALYDLTGRQVAEIANETLTSGHYNYTINGANLSTGIYLLQTSIDNTVNIQKLVLSK